MKAMNVEKKILNGIKIENLVNVQANEFLEYSQENKGKRAIGYVKVSGQFISEGRLRNYEDSIEMDIFAPSNKLNGEEFLIRLKDVNGVVDDGIMIYLDFEIEGIKEENKDEQSMIIKQDDDEITIEGIEDLFEDNQNVYTSCRLIIAKNDDTYESIASRYQIDVDEIKSLNKNQPILPKQCILIP